MAKATDQVSAPIQEFRALWRGRLNAGTKIQCALNNHRRLGIEWKGQGVGGRLI
jgi:hypothetical protein